MSTMHAVSENHPMMKAWNRWCETEEFKTALMWAYKRMYDDGRSIDIEQVAEHAKGSMWLAFTKGMEAVEHPTPEPVPIKGYQPTGQIPENLQPPNVGPSAVYPARGTERPPEDIANASFYLDQGSTTHKWGTAWRDYALSLEHTLAETQAELDRMRQFKGVVAPAQLTDPEKYIAQLETELAETREQLAKQTSVANAALNLREIDVGAADVVTARLHNETVDLREQVSRLERELAIAQTQLTIANQGGTRAEESRKP